MAEVRQPPPDVCEFLLGIIHYLQLNDPSFLKFNLVIYRKISAL
ncbi:hypothetical protein HDF22_000416 [Mucilaginibacter lappiensis]|uniref:Uncharacterized protein n=1 Tax=Mucilaginibacter lappiensis TaxID=354630 RepID=A0A841JCW3_9SPHI|nr:hypothetical protein [Mucilaginibacter lappiensis]